MGNPLLPDDKWNPENNVSSNKYIINFYSNLTRKWGCHYVIFSSCIGLP